MDSVYLEIYASDKRPLAWTSGLPPQLLSYKIPGAAAYCADAQEQGQIILQQIYAKTYGAWVYHFLVNKASSIFLKNRIDRKDILFYYIIKGRFQYRSNLQAVNTDGGYMNAITIPAIDHELQFEHPGAYTVLHVVSPEDYLLELQDSFAVIWSLLQHSKSEQPLSYFRQDVKLPPQVYKLVKDIVTGSMQQTQQQDFLKDNLELLVIATLDMLNEPPVIAAALTDREKETANNIRLYLLQQIHESHLPELPKLAKMAGTNGKKLEELFKTAYGFTMFRYFQQIRMQAIAKRLQAKEPPKRVSEVFNYKSYTNFHNAVKEWWGVTPRQLSQRG